MGVAAIVSRLSESTILGGKCSLTCDEECPRLLFLFKVYFKFDVFLDIKTK